MRDVGALIVLALVLLLAGCAEEPATGPVPIKYGRDTCDFCRMVISDPRHAAEIRGGPGHQVYKYDDLGEGLIHLGRQTWKDDANVEIWVMDMTNGRTWLDARKAFYVPVRQSPMGFNYGAITDKKPGALTFEEFRAASAKSAAAAFCATPQTAMSDVGGARAKEGRP
jgi:nitrous oxide reductase accessory protein NosL